MSLLNSVLKVFVGDKTKKGLAKILPLTDEINAHFNSFKDLSNDELRNKTQIFKDKLKSDLREVNQRIHWQVHVQAQAVIFEQVEKDAVCDWRGKGRSDGVPGHGRVEVIKLANVVIREAHLAHVVLPRPQAQRQQT